MTLVLDASDWEPGMGSRNGLLDRFIKAKKDRGFEGSFRDWLEAGQP